MEIYETLLWIIRRSGGRCVEKECTCLVLCEIIKYRLIATGMIKVYLDWNIFAQMKGGYQNDLLNILSNKDRFFIPFSTSHIGDILSSYSEDSEQKERIDNDLEFITNITDNHCLSNNGKDIIINQSDPKLLFQDRVENKDFMANFSLDTLEKTFSENELTKEIGKRFITLLKSISLDPLLKDIYENPDSSKSFNQVFPGLKENPTMDGLFKSFRQMYQNLNETEDYKKLRETTQKGLGIKRDKIFNDENPYNIIDSAHDKIKLPINDKTNNSKNAPEWFNKITNEFLMLDMHGYQEDTVKVEPNKRKETFKNTIEDSFHCAFASTCNIYIINDKKSYNKARQIYKRLDINTKVFKPNQFLEYYDKYLNIESAEYHINNLFDIIKSHSYHEYLDAKGFQKIYLIPYFIFDIFNKIVVVQPANNEKPFIFLSKLSPTNSNYTHYTEIRNLVKMLNEYYGNDIKNKGAMLEEELQTENWDGRIWKINDSQLRLVSLNGYIQLYFDL